MIDFFDRDINYMRISITDRCNLRCRYCMPSGIEWKSMSNILSYEEILLACQEAVALGITRFKVTGGEPLVRKGAVDFIRRLKTMSGVEKVTLTTNGVYLDQYLDQLVECGIDGINISIDTMDREQYEQITGFDKLNEVVSNIKAAAMSGLKVKVNSVLLDGINNNAWKELLFFAREYPVDVRFIEMMPIGFGKKFPCVKGDDILNRIKAEYPDTTIDTNVHGNGPAVYYKIDGFKGSVGFINAIHGKFCNTCNRIRLTSTGEIKACLCFENTVDLSDALRSGNTFEVRKLLERAIEQKPLMHCFEKPGEISEMHRMSQIGG